MADAEISAALGKAVLLESRLRSALKQVRQILAMAAQEPPPLEQHCMSHAFTGACSSLRNPRRAPIFCTVGRRKRAHAFHGGFARRSTSTGESGKCSSPSRTTCAGYWTHSESSVMERTRHRAIARSSRSSLRRAPNPTIGHVCHSPLTPACCTEDQSARESRAS